MMSQNITPAGCKFAIEEKPMNLETPKAILYFFTKLYSYVSFGLLSVSIVVATGINDFFELIFKDVPEKEIIMPLTIAGITFLGFMITFTIDFLTGIVASKTESAQKSFIKSSRLWSSVWKLLGVCAILLFLLLFHYIFIIINIGFVSAVFEVVIPGFMIIVILYEIHSIGENIERRYGKKPKYFNFFEKLANVFEKAVLNKIQKLIK